MNLIKDQGGLSNLILAADHSKTALFLGVNLQSEQAGGQIKTQRGTRANASAIKMHCGPQIAIF
jgi:hypothetical protein